MPDSFQVVNAGSRLCDTTTNKTFQDKGFKFQMDFFFHLDISRFHLQTYSLTFRILSSCTGASLLISLHLNAMASAVNYGHKALITAVRFCDEPGCPCKSDPETHRARANNKLQPSHHLKKTAFNAICLDLDQNPITDRPPTSTGEKQRDDGNFDRVVEEAFKVSSPSIPVITLMVTV